MGGNRPDPRSGQILKRQVPLVEKHVMNPLDPNTSRLPPPLRALVMGLVVDMVVPLLNNSREENSVPARYDGDGADARAASWQDLRWKCDELSALVLRAD